MTPSEFLAARKRVGLSQADAAKFGGCSQATLMRYETDRLPTARASSVLGLQVIYDALLAMPARAPKRRGRPPVPPKSAAEIDRLRVDRKLRLIHKSEADDDRELTDWAKLHETPKHGLHSKKKAEPPEFRSHDRDWLWRQVKHSLKAESLGVVNEGGHACFVVDAKDIMNLCEKVIDVTGGKLK
jgi:transcriptional regulator with XRE-family HTH domain